MRPSKKTAEGRSGEKAYFCLPFISPVQGNVDTPREFFSLDARLRTITNYFLCRRSDSRGNRPGHVAFPSWPYCIAVATQIRGAFEAQRPSCAVAALSLGRRAGRDRPSRLQKFR